MIIPLDFYNGKYYLRYGATKEIINFPFREALVAIAFEEVEGDIVKIGIIDIISAFSSNDNEHNIQLKNVEQDEVKGMLDKVFQ